MGFPSFGGLYRKGGLRIDDNYDFIQAAVNSTAPADLGGVDSVSGATLEDTANYIALILETAGLA